MLISVIIPVYNSEQNLSRCMESIINQTYKNLEIICIYDRSKDNSLSILKGYELKDNRIKIITSDVAKGLATARNKGIGIATGDYISFIDSDDFINLNFYEKLNQKATETNADIVMAETFIRFANGAEIFLRNVPGAYMDFKQKFRLIKNGAVWDKIFKREFLLKHNLKFPDKHLWEDNLFILKAIYYSSIFATVSGTNYNYIMNSSSLTNSASKLMQRKNSSLYISNEMMSFALDKKLDDEALLLIKQFIVQNIYKQEHESIDPNYNKNMTMILNRTK